jgi:hypothetical protein
MSRRRTSPPKPSWRRRINAANEELIGVHYRSPGSVMPCVVDAVNAEIEGALFAVNTLSNMRFETDAATVRAALAAMLRRKQP